MVAKKSCHTSWSCHAYRVVRLYVSQLHDDFWEACCVNPCISYRCNCASTCQRATCFTRLDNHFLFYWPMMKVYKIMGQSQINGWITITEPCCRVRQPTVTLVLSNIMIRLPVAIRQVLLSNPAVVTHSDPCQCSQVHQCFMETLETSWQRMILTETGVFPWSITTT